MFCRNKIKIPVGVYAKFQRDELPTCDICGGILDNRYSRSGDFVVGYVEHKNIDCIKRLVKQVKELGTTTTARGHRLYT